MVVVETGDKKKDGENRSFPLGRGIWRPGLAGTALADCGGGLCAALSEVVLSGFDSGRSHVSHTLSSTVLQAQNHATTSLSSFLPCPPLCAQSLLPFVSCPIRYFENGISYYRQIMSVKWRVLEPRRLRIVCDEKLKSRDWLRLSGPVHLNAVRLSSNQPLFHGVPVISWAWPVSYP